MKIQQNKNRVLELIIGLGLSAAQPVLFAQTYDWLSWAYPTNHTASAHIAGAGDIIYSVAGAAASSIDDMRIHFDGVPFTPVDAHAIGTTYRDNAIWIHTLDLSSLPATGGLVLGCGNFGYGTENLPGYRLTAFDRSTNVMDLNTFTQIGSYDHTWTDYAASFNDDIHLNVTNGNFEVTRISGLNENNSDILLLSLPPGVSRLVISSLGNTSGDTVNFLVAVPHLNFQSQNSMAVFGWASADSNLVLQATTTLSPPSWADTLNQPVFTNGMAKVTNSITGSASFFRLRLR